MRTLELQPTEKNIKETYLKDSIGRNDALHRFVDALNAIEDCCSIALDSAWGSGKTFFVKQAKRLLDALNPCVTIYETGSTDEIERKWHDEHPGRTETPKPQISIYYDAWENDNDDDPLLSIIHTILSQVKTDYQLKQPVDLVALAVAIYDACFNKKLMAVRDALKRDAPLNNIKTAKDLRASINRFFDSLLLEQGNRLVLFIDELDRCRPSFAVTLLERIKHYFSNEKITFVFSVNMYELQGTIKNYYGNEFDACRYLDRFFDLRMSLPPIDTEKYIRSMQFCERDYQYDRVAYEVIKYYHFEMREIIKYIRLLKIAAYRPAHDSKQYSFITGAELFCIRAVIPVMLGLRMRNMLQYRSFIEGKDGTPFFEIIPRYEHWGRLCEGLLYNGEAYDDDKTNSRNQDTLVRLENKLHEVYEALFDYSDPYKPVRVGGYEFDAETRSMLMNTQSLLSEFSDFHM